jgi:ABC-type Fe3+/spermidine/putrescine transport system ATPase subunit
MSDEVAVRCVGLSVDYPGTRAVHRLDLTVARGEAVAVLGASGSGKSTLLHAIAGLVSPAEGEIWLAGRRVADPRRSAPPERRAVGLVFQDFALWPHLNALDTVAYPLRRAGLRPRAARARAQRLLDQLGVGALAGRRPAELSGGQQQRVGLARALAREPGVFLLDEPTAHLDTHLRMAFQDNVRERRVSTGAAVLYATHDAGEALSLADRVAVIAAGRLVQLGSPEQVYAEPVDATTALLTGPGAVLLASAARTPAGQLAVDLGNGPVVVPGGGTDDPSQAARRLLIRPEWVRVGGPFSSRVVARAFRGPHTDYAVPAGNGRVWLREPGPPRFGVGEPLSWGLERAWVLGDGSPRSTERSEGGRVIEPAVDQVEV